MRSETLISVVGAVLVGLAFLFPSPARADEVESRRCKTGDTACTIGEFLYDDNYVPVPPANASCTLSIVDPASTPLGGSPFAMSEAADGWYFYNFDTTAQADGLYRSNMCCTVTVPTSQTLCLDKSFTVGASFNSLADIAIAVWGGTSRTLTDFGTLVTDIWNNLTRSLTTRNIGLGENIAREEEHWTTRFAGDGEVLAGQTYRATIWILNFETELSAPAVAPTYTIYDSMLNPVSSGTMTLGDTAGVYNLSYAVSGSATGGRWKTIVNVDVDGGGNDIQDGSYWEVESSPAQVTINAITDNTIPSITANVTIKNEGGSGYEYKYSYCVVSTENNPCGGGNDVFYNSGSKYLNAGESWIKNFNATVPDPGTYWFKVVVQWGTEKSGATQIFTTGSVACLGDYNLDGWVNLTDFSIMLFYWNQYNPAHDLSGDGYVNLTDFSILLFHWGKCP